MKQSLQGKIDKLEETAKKIDAQLGELRRVSERETANMLTIAREVLDDVQGV